jgi:hypothetical protein
VFWVKQEPEPSRLFLLAKLDNKQEQGSIRQALHRNWERGITYVPNENADSSPGDGIPS